MIAAIIGTGPSLTIDQINAVSHLPKFGVNNAAEFNLDVHIADPKWYNYYGVNFKAEKWTWDKKTADRFNINYIEGLWLPGLSTDPKYIHYHHGTGPQIINIAYHYGVKVMLLLGYDMRYGEKRHYFGEYPKPLLHWPQTGPNGEFTGLIKEMESIKPEKYGIQIYNCTPNSALTCYPYRSILEFQNVSNV